MAWQKQITAEGEFVRKDSAFRNHIVDGGQFAPAANRYHLYVSFACPWAHRTLIVRKLKGLEKSVSVDVVHSFLGSDGWTFDDSEEGATGDSVNQFRLLREAYQATEPGYAGSITVPVLWDKESRRIVNNESSEIIRMLNSELQAHAEHPELDLYPEDLRPEIDELNAWIYTTVNNGVYRAGFARSQGAYEKAVDALFVSLDRLEAILSKKRYLTGSQLTEADIRLVTTLVRFDAVYVTHFKCNVRRIIDYPHLWGYVRELYSLPAVAATTHFKHIKDHYFRSHEGLNPCRIVPRGPELDFSQPHGRERL